MDNKFLNKVADQLQNEKEKHFEERTKKHIELVQQAAKKIVDKFPEFKDLLNNVEKHDASKFEEPEKTPYISITWRQKEKDYKPEKDKGVRKEDENEATLHHIKTNPHHPEYWNKDEANINKDDRSKSDKCIDASKMDDLAVAEMVADWQAMSEELKKNTARQWFDKQKNVRWKFSEHQEELIDKLLKVFEV